MRLIAAIATMSVALLATAWADDEQADEILFADVAARLASPAVLRGSFVQTRQLELISKPLRSSGVFMLSEMGLYWRQDEPLQSVMIADSERLLQSIDGGPLQSIDVARNPLLLSFSRSFLSIFAGSEDDLRANFDLHFEPASDEARYWTIKLRPNSYPMSEAIDSIILHGREYIEELNVISRTSDKTTISCSDLQTEPGQLTEHEIELYAP